MQISIVNLQNQFRVPQSFVMDWVELVCKSLIKKKLNPNFKKNLQKDLTVVFVTAKEIKKLNKQFRGKDKPTDILSFADIMDEQLGELILCPEIIVKQAKEHGLTQKQEYAYMLLHGVLHLLGYDHEEPTEAKKMFKLQDDLFAALMPLR